MFSINLVFFCFPSNFFLHRAVTGLSNETVCFSHLVLTIAYFYIYYKIDKKKTSIEQFLCGNGDMENDGHIFKHLHSEQFIISFLISIQLKILPTHSVIFMPDITLHKRRAESNFFYLLFLLFPLHLRDLECLT